MYYFLTDSRKTPIHLFCFPGITLKTVKNDQQCFFWGGGMKKRKSDKGTKEKKSDKKNNNKENHYESKFIGK